MTLSRKRWSSRFRSAEVTGSYCKSTWLLRFPRSSLGGVGGGVYDERMRQCASFTDDVAFLRPQNLRPIISTLEWPRGCGAGRLSLLSAWLTNPTSPNRRSNSGTHTIHVLNVSFQGSKETTRKFEGRRAGCYSKPKTSVYYRHVMHLWRVMDGTTLCFHSGHDHACNNASGVLVHFSRGNGLKLFLPMRDGDGGRHYLRCCKRTGQLVASRPLDLWCSSQEARHAIMSRYFYRINDMIYRPNLPLREHSSTRKAGSHAGCVLDSQPPVAEGRQRERHERRPLHVWALVTP